MSRTLRLVVVALVMVLASYVGAAEPGPAAPPVVLTVPLCPKPPVIDGKIAPEEWAAAFGTEGFIVVGRAEHGLDRRQARAWVTADSLKAVFDDSLEVYVTPTPDALDRVAAVQYRC